jgi:ribosomal protein S18 acetylase RimI-like enzyme
MPTPHLVIRRATRQDLPALGRLGASLLRLHHAFDRERFMAPGDRPEDGYACFLGTQLDDNAAAVFVSERAGMVDGYIYVGIEPQSWKELRDEAGFVHDLVVEVPGMGTGRALLEAALEWLRARGVPRVVLWTAEPNEAARRLFARAGFRSTMIEMTKELSTGG